MLSSQRVAGNLVMKTETRKGRIWVIRTTLGGELIEFAGKTPTQAAQAMGRASASATEAATVKVA
ncbi:MAG: hypothetical protein K6L60_05460 [Oceanobacter sp.]